MNRVVGETRKTGPQNPAPILDFHRVGRHVSVHSCLYTWKESQTHACMKNSEHTAFMVLGFRKAMCISSGTFPWEKPQSPCPPPALVAPGRTSYGAHLVLLGGSSWPALCLGYKPGFYPRCYPSISPQTSGGCQLRGFQRRSSPASSERLAPPLRKDQQPDWAELWQKPRDPPASSPNGAHRREGAKRGCWEPQKACLWGQAVSGPLPRARQCQTRDSITLTASTEYNQEMHQLKAHLIAWWDFPR